MLLPHTGNPYPSTCAQSHAVPTSYVIPHNQTTLLHGIRGALLHIITCNFSSTAARNLCKKCAFRLYVHISSFDILFLPKIFACTCFSFDIGDSYQPIPILMLHLRRVIPTNIFPFSCACFNTLVIPTNIVQFSYIIFDSGNSYHYPMSAIWHRVARVWPRVHSQCQFGSNLQYHCGISSVFGQNYPFILSHLTVYWPGYGLVKYTCVCVCVCVSVLSACVASALVLIRFISVEQWF